MPIKNRQIEGGEKNSLLAFVIYIFCLRLKTVTSQINLMAGFMVGSYFPPSDCYKVIVQLEAFPRRLKPCWFDSFYGAAEAAPFQNNEFVIDLRVGSYFPPCILVLD